METIPNPMNVNNVQQHSKWRTNLIDTLPLFMRMFDLSATFVKKNTREKICWMGILVQSTGIKLKTIFFEIKKIKIGVNFVSFLFDYHCTIPLMSWILIVEFWSNFNLKIFFVKSKKTELLDSENKIVSLILNMPMK